MPDRFPVQSGSSPRPLRVLFAGGASGGHLTPAFAVAEALPEVAGARPVEVLLLGSERPLEQQLLERQRLPEWFQARALPSAPYLRGKELTFVWTQAQGVWRARQEVTRFRPDVALALGGFAALPGAVAARLCGVPLALYEPNATPGLANRVISRWASEAYVHWRPGGLSCPSVVTGVPLSPQASGESLVSEAARTRLGLPADRPAVLVMGGSQGARQLNDWLRESLAQLPSSRLQGVSLVASTGDPEATQALCTACQAHGLPHRIEDYLDPVGLAYQACDLAIVRGGAATLAETLAHGLFAWVLPLRGQAGDHQLANAQALARTGAGRVLGQLGPRTLIAAVEAAQNTALLVWARARARQAARPAAARAVAQRLLALSEKTHAAARRAA